VDANKHPLGFSELIFVLSKHATAPSWIMNLVLYFLSALFFIHHNGSRISFVLKSLLPFSPLAFSTHVF